MHENSERSVRNTAGLESGPGISEVLCNFKLVLEEKTDRELPN